ncbi:MAG: mechanosensitive ion channel [Hyphomonadaceae bacterium]
MALAIFVVALTVSWLFRSAMDRLRKRVDAGHASALYVAARFGRYLIVFVGLLTAGSALGLDMSSLSLFAGALGVGIGLGLQDIVKNFMAGLVLLLDKSIEVGDFIELEGGITGEVSAIGARATTVLTNDNVDVLLPNSMLLSGSLTNWTRNHATRRIHVPFSVAYGSDKEKVRMAAVEAARSIPFTLPDTESRRTQVWLTGFGDSALNFELVVWPTLQAVKRPGSMMAAYFWAIDDALRRHGIEIPFPQRDLRLRGFFGLERGEAQAAWRGESAPPPHDAAPERPNSRSTNDAAREIQTKAHEEARAQLIENAPAPDPAPDEE